jgi:hypothetical protein
MKTQQVNITLKSGQKFTKHEPATLSYYMAFSNRADFLFYDIGLYEPLVLSPYDEVTFEIIPSAGASIKFVGYLYNKKNLGKANAVRLHFVSKYFKGMLSMEPLYGKGNLSDIASAFYTKAGITAVDADSSDITFDNLLFPRTACIDDAISYLMHRATAPTDSYLVSTIIGDTAYIRNIKNGKEDIKATAQTEEARPSGGGTVKSGGLYYIPVQVNDDRLRVDAKGGLKLSVSSDAANVDAQSFSSKGTNEITNNLFYGLSNKALVRAKGRVQQLTSYYTSYTALLSVLGSVPLIGSNLIVDKNDITSSSTWFKTLDEGKYFINSQALFIDFKQSYPKTQIGVQMIDDKA